MKTLYESILSSTKSGKQSLELDGYHIGDIVVSAYSYSSRHVDFYEITNIKGKTITAKRLLQKVVSGDWQNGTCIPVLGQYDTKPEVKCRVGKRGLRINDCYTYKWNGKPESFYTD